MATCNFQVHQSQEKEIENQVLMKKCLFQWFCVTLIDVFIQKISITPPLPFLVWMLCSACDQTEWAWWWMCSVKITGDHLNTFVTQQPRTNAIKAKRLITFHLLFIKHELVEVRDSSAKKPHYILILIQSLLSFTIYILLTRRCTPLLFPPCSTLFCICWLLFSTQGQCDYSSL